MTSVTTNNAKPWPAVSVIIITRGRHASAAAAVKSVLASDYPADLREVIVLEETNAPEPISGLGVKYFHIPERRLGFGYARNRAIAHATGEILVFTDDDCRVTSDWLREIVRPLHDDPAVIAVAGAVRVPPCGIIGQCENILGFPGGGLAYLHRAQGKIIPCATFSTCNCAVRRDALVAAGGFDETLKYGGEDEKISRILAQQGRLVFSPFATVEHMPRDSIGGVWHWFLRRGRAHRHIFFAESPTWKKWLAELKHFQLVRLLILAIILALLPGKLWRLLALAAAAAAYAIISIVRRRWALHYNMPLKALLAAPWVKLIMDVAFEFGFIFGKRHG